MYPDGELNQLAVYKAILRRRITRRREDCGVAAAGALRPFAWLDRAIVFWRQINPLAKLAVIPMGLLLKRVLFPRVGFIGKLLRWAPMIFTAGRAFTVLHRPARAQTG